MSRTQRLSDVFLLFVVAPLCGVSAAAFIIFITGRPF